MFIRVVRFFDNIRDIVCGSESQGIKAYRRCFFFGSRGSIRCQ